jgi:hypothetical protein
MELVRCAPIVWIDGWIGALCGIALLLGDLGESTIDIDANGAMWELFSTVKLP